VVEIAVGAVVGTAVDWARPQASAANVMRLKITTIRLYLIPITPF
jgi:hypothetical protein